MTTGTHRTEILADSDVPLIRITREFDSPPVAVFRAHADPGLVVRWLGPRRGEMHIDHYTCRTGGSYRYVLRRGPDEMGFRGCFHEVRSGELIVQTFTYEAEPHLVALERMVFEPIREASTRLTVTSLVDSFEERDAMLSGGMEDGIRDSYERLEELLAR